MKIVADAASKWTGHSHEVISPNARYGSLEGDENGDVSFIIRSSHLSLTGNYLFRFKLSSEEIRQLVRASETSYLKRRIESLEVQIKKLKSTS